MIEDSPGIGVVRRQFFAVFIGVAFVGAFLVVRQDGAGRLKLVINLGHGDYVTMAGK